MAEPGEHRADGPRHGLLRPIDRRRDHVRGGGAPRGVGTGVLYADYLCPYCRRLRPVLDRLRAALGERLAYVYRHFPNERIHPGAELLAHAAEAADRQHRFWQMHDAIYSREPPVTENDALEIAAAIGLDMARFRRDLADPAVR